MKALVSSRGNGLKIIVYLSIIFVMANPRFRFTRSRRDSRRANWKVNPQNFYSCPNCGKPKLPHRICLSCGFYNGKFVYLEMKKEKKEGK